MRARSEWRWAFTAMAAVAGTGLIPGRAHAFFFAQTGSAAWLGIAAATVLFGAMAGALVCWERGAGSVERRAASLDPDRLERARRVLRGTLAALAAAMMLVRAGEIGALTLPLRGSYALGAALALVAALAVGVRCGAPPAGAGAALTAVVAMFYAGMALDPHPVRFHGRSETALRLSGDWRSALLLALMFAAMNACLLGLSPPPRARMRPGAAGVKAGLLMGGVLVLSNLALLRGGDRLLAQAAPWALLCARWGLVGFWLCAALEFLCAASTLSICAGALIEGSRQGRARRAIAAFMLLASLLLFALLSFDRL